MSWPYLWFLPRAFSIARGPRVSADARSSLHPLMEEGSMLVNNSGTDVSREREMRAGADADNHTLTVIPDKRAVTRAPIRDP
ncbi:MULTISPECIES: hypothetical protein [unclassified Bradyrhizobium]|uniref:hypothetical protein n=1 Tax=unclassified Bradyrhizobium TaxID=2631580 RepID=UPI002916B2CB|nr:MULTISPECIES: hypothetical protein [unclassified Bradyrhizobium]